MGFLEHREALRTMRIDARENTMRGSWRRGIHLDSDDFYTKCISSEEPQQSEMGEILVFFGCRGESDFLFKDRLLEFQQSGVLSSLSVAMSRTQADKVYVTHKIREEGARLVDLLKNRNASIFICGDGNSMAKDVQTAFKSILAEHGDWSDVGADECIKSLKDEGRLVLDVWS